jgi:hypothetical protein
MREPDGVLRHLRHAEEWLRWARSDYRKGDLRGTVLRLLLAEAEVRHAREAGSQRLEDGPARPTRRVNLVAAGALGAAALAVAAYAVFVSGGRATNAAALPVAPSAHVAPAGDGSWGVVRLDTGDLLTLMSPAPQASPETSSGANDGVSGERFVDELMSSFGQGTLTSTGGPATLATPGDSERPAAAF